MIECFVCQEEISTNMKVFLQHLNAVHNLNDSNARYTCMQQQCYRTFGSKFAFVRHVTSNHPSVLRPGVISQASEVFSVQQSPDAIAGAEPISSDIVPSRKQETISDLACKFIIQGKRQMAILQSVNFMVGACTEIVQSVIGNLYDDFKVLRTSSTGSAWESLEKFKLSLDPLLG
jgi:hypothetical protein